MIYTVTKGKGITVKLLLLFLWVSAQTHASELSVHDFNKMPMFQHATISPNGEMIASVFNDGTNTSIVVAPYGTTDILSIAKLAKDKYRIESVHWLNDKRILAEISSPFKLIAYGKRSLERKTTLFSIAIDGSSSLELKTNKSKTSSLEAFRESPELLSLLPEDKDHILVEIRDARDDYYSSVFKVNVNDGDFDKYMPNGLRIYRWGIDRKGQVRFALGADKDHRSTTRHIYFRQDNDSDWQHIRSFTPFADETFSPFLYEAQTHSLLVESDHKLKKNAVWRYDLAKGEFTELVAEAPGNLDVTSPLYWRSKGQTHFIGINYLDHFVTHKYTDQGRANMYGQIRQLFAKQGLQAYITDRDENQNRHIIYAVSDSSPGKYYLYDKATQKIGLWFSQHPHLEKTALTPVTPIAFEARDGMKLNGYLTLPKNVSKPPLVVFPHGGPHAADSQYFDPWVQMMANQGYAVLQVNYRGSTGFGNDYETAGYRQWGKAIQDDIEDALAYVQQQQLVDNNKTCIAGISYGGYASLVAGFKQPEQYKCIVSIAGVASLQDMYRRDAVWNPTTTKKYFREAVFDPDNEQELKEAESLSPVNQAAQFTAPVLLIHGESDTIVHFNQSEIMQEALTKAGKKVEYISFEYGTHHLNDSTNREQAMLKVAEFLGKHLN